MNLSPNTPANTFSEKLPLKAYSFGMGGLGLPGDLSSASRFIKAVFTKENSLCNEDENSAVSQFFHILTSVEQQRGCVCTDGTKYEITKYSSCCNLNKRVYYYRTYENSTVTAVNLFHEDLTQNNLIIYPLKENTEITYLN